MESSRISLRPFKLSDVEDFMSWAGDDRVTRYVRWNTITSTDKGLQVFEGGDYTQDENIGDDRCRAHIGYALGWEYWGQGIVTVALKMALSIVFKEFPDLVRVQALVEVENKGSQRVLEKVGFLKEGLLRKYGFNKGEVRDMFIYGFLSTDPIPD
ncbi:uncharacterized N-acetyltransferase p20-like [Vitis riparia]|uniref:uncharacterized N-acetyltransferase p20-like n=1 Tax=Vitis riparia TaxID=96939 RepID=UPI00155A6FE2|nr:uncharacterized N-acetyltransferase p20-like [Vitis riparia]